MATINSNTATLTVTTPPPPTIASALIGLDANSVNVGQTDKVTLSLFDAFGKPITTLPANASVTYAAVDESVATIQANGSASNPLESPITTLKTGSTGFFASIDQ